MSLSLRWVGQESYEAVARARQQSYAVANQDMDRYRDGMTADPRAKAGDFLLAESNGRPVGTATSLSLTLWAGGAAFPCQGVGYVGTVHTARRSAAKTGAARSPGVASQIMAATLNRARERGEVVSTLMPFRASFYEHFGYGIVERRHDWTVPITIMPPGDTEGFRFYEEADFEPLVALHQQIVQRRQCDMERSPAMWQFYLRRADAPWYIVDAEDAPSGRRRIRSWLTLSRVQENGKDYARVMEMGYDSAASLIRQLRFLGTLRDQYFAARLTLPVDLPLNHLLRESQLPHRLVNHATAECRPYTRMQLRILDHKRFLESLRFGPAYAHIKGKVDLTINECDGEACRLLLDVADGRISTSASALARTPTFTCASHTWASIACGTLRATDALEYGLAEGDPAAAEAISLLSHVCAPFTSEYF